MRRNVLISSIAIALAVWDYIELGDERTYRKKGGKQQKGMALGGEVTCDSVRNGPVRVLNAGPQRNLLCPIAESC